MTDGEAGAVPDASALLAYLRDETGGEAVGAMLAAGAVINAVNDAEALSRLGDAGEAPAAIHRRLREAGIVGDLLRVVPLVEDDGAVIARSRPLTRPLPGRPGCLATALRLGWPAITADRAWAAIDVGAVVRPIRP